MNLLTTTLLTAIIAFSANASDTDLDETERGGCPPKSAVIKYVKQNQELFTLPTGRSSKHIATLPSLFDAQETEWKVFYADRYSQEPLDKILAGRFSCNYGSAQSSINGGKNDLVVRF